MSASAIVNSLYRLVLLPTLAVFMTIVSLGCTVISDCGSNSETIEEAHACGGGEVVVRFENRPIFCPHATDLFTGIVTVDADGTYKFCGTSLNETFDSCSNCFREPDMYQPCLVEVSLRLHVLTEQQAAELETLLDNVPERICVDNGIAVDPCFLPTYAFRGRQETSFCTYGDLIGDFPEAIAAVGGFLHDLASND